MTFESQPTTPHPTDIGRCRQNHRSPVVCTQPRRCKCSFTRHAGTKSSSSIPPHIFSYWASGSAHHQPNTLYSTSTCVSTQSCARFLTQNATSPAPTDASTTILPCSLPIRSCTYWSFELLITSLMIPGGLVKSSNSQHPRTLRCTVSRPPRSRPNRPRSWCLQMHGHTNTLQGVLHG